MALTHSTGFHNFWFIEPDQKLRIHFAPGSRYSYSGEGFSLLQFTIEQGARTKGLGLDLKDGSGRIQLFAQQAVLGDEERAARALEGVLRDVPDHQEAMGFLTEFYSSKERWADLVAPVARYRRPPGPRLLIEVFSRGQ